MKKILFCCILAIIFSSCGNPLLKNITKQLPPLENDAEVAVYDMGDTVPENAEILGGIALTCNTDWETLLEIAKQEARAAGGNSLEVQLRANAFPNQNKRQSHLISAFILNVNDDVVPAKTKAFHQEAFNDYVVMNDGDTIPCLIVFETKRQLQFIYGYERHGNRKAMSLHKSDLLSYHIEDPSVLKKYRQLSQPFQMIVNVDGGYSMSGGKSNYPDNYSQHLSNGFTGFCDVRFNINNGATLGLHYGYGNYKGKTHFYEQAPYPYDNYYIENTKNSHQQIHFIAGSLGLATPIITKRQRLDCLLDGGCEITPSMKKHWIYYNLLFGYLFYKEKYPDDNIILTGGTFGIGYYFGYDYLITDHLGIGIGSGATIGFSFNATGRDSNDQIITRNIKPAQIDLFAGLRYYF